MFLLDGAEGLGTPSGQTPIRDSLGINMDTGLPDGGSSFRSTSTISQQREEMRAQLKAGLSSLPTPKNDYEIVIPEVRGLVTLAVILAIQFCTITAIVRGRRH